MFKTTSTGYRATDETVAFWISRDTCPDCGSIETPHKVEEGTNHYRCSIDPDVTWTRKA